MATYTEFAETVLPRIKRGLGLQRPFFFLCIHFFLKFLYSIFSICFCLLVGWWVGCWIRLVCLLFFVWFFGWTLGVKEGWLGQGVCFLEEMVGAWFGK